MPVPKPTLQDLNLAHRSFLANEPRDLFYRAATELVELAIRRKTSLTLGEALAVLLQTWNRSFYRFQPFDAEHFMRIEGILNENAAALTRYRRRSIETLATDDDKPISELFTSFEMVLGPVGAAKSLHLLAPRFFPLWDRAIAAAYGWRLRKRGANAAAYCSFMMVTQAQIERTGGEAAIGRSPLKAMDEYNYCRLTKRWP